MSWYTVAAAAARTRHLWVQVTGDGAPEYGRWITPAGHDVDIVLGKHGPRALDVPVWWVPFREHHGKQPTDLLWAGTLRLKLMSVRMLQVLEGQGARLQVFEDVDIRLRDGSSLGGYVGVLEETRRPGPVHSYWNGRRSHRMVISEEVRAAIVAAGLKGLEIAPVEGPFPAGRPKLFPGWRD